MAFQRAAASARWWAAQGGRRRSEPRATRGPAARPVVACLVRDPAGGRPRRQTIYPRRRRACVCRTAVGCRGSRPPTVYTPRRPPPAGCRAPEAANGGGRLPPSVHSCGCGLFPDRVGRGEAPGGGQPPSRCRPAAPWGWGGHPSGRGERPAYRSSRRQARACMPRCTQNRTRTVRGVPSATTKQERSMAEETQHLRQSTQG